MTGARASRGPAAVLDWASSQTGKIDFVTVPTNIFQNTQARPYEDLRGDIRNGDILLFSGVEKFSRLIQWATHSPWSHVGFVFKLPHVDRLMILQSVTGAGVSTVPLSGLINGSGQHRAPYAGRLLVARHTDFEKQVTDGKLGEMSKFAVDRFGEPYAMTEVIKVMLRIGAGWLHMKMPPLLQPTDEYICSEYAAACYEKIGIKIAWDGLGFIAPSDFAFDPKVVPVGVIQTRAGKPTPAAPQGHGIRPR